VVDYLEHALQHADDRAIRAVLAFGEPAQPVEVTEELVGSVDEVDDHLGSTLDMMESRASPRPCRKKAQRLRTSVPCVAPISAR
jgi:hypothetical protein